MKKKFMKYEHAISNIPNNWFFRLLVHLINKRMSKSQSLYRLNIRYRKPRKGKSYGWGGSLKRKEARKFSIYINMRDGNRDWLQRYYMEELNKRDYIINELQKALKHEESGV